MELKVQHVKGETWKDLVEVPEDSRIDPDGKHIPRGSVCKMKANGRSRYVVVVGLKDETGVIGMDLNLRRAFAVSVGSSCDLKLYPASWLGQILFGWSASDPAYRIPSQLAAIALFLGTSLGIVGVILGAIPIIEEIHGPLFKNLAASGPSTVVTGLNYPQSIAVDTNGNLYIGDQGCINFIGVPGDCNVYKETLSNGTYTQSVIASLSASNSPQGIAVDKSGNVFIAVTGNGVLQETPLGGGKYAQTTIGCGFSAPGGVAVDSQGTLYVTDRSGSSINSEKATDTCSTIGLVASGLSVPTGLTIDGAASVYVIQAGAPGTVLKESRAGNTYNATTVAGGGRFNGISVDVQGNVFLTSGDGNLYEYSLPTINSPNYSYVSLAFGFAVPAGVAVDMNGNIYVVNTGFNEIVKIPAAQARAQNPRKPFVIHPDSAGARD